MTSQYFQSSVIVIRSSTLMRARSFVGAQTRKPLIGMYFPITQFTPSVTETCRAVSSYNGAGANCEKKSPNSAKGWRLNRSHDRLCIDCIDTTPFYQQNTGLFSRTLVMGLRRQLKKLLFKKTMDRPHSRLL